LTDQKENPGSIIWRHGVEQPKITIAEAALFLAMLFTAQAGWPGPAFFMLLVCMFSVVARWERGRQ
jgi:hypothetical protein